jgi:hypothetical protein
VALVLAAGGGLPAPARADDLERQLLKQAPKVIQYLQDKGYQNVGVLKFRVKKGDGPISDRAGTLNLTLADRLELALVLADDFKKPVGIIRNASAVAARIKGANHLTKEGRQKLFDGSYPLAWGDQEVPADAFLTGVVQVSPDLDELTVGILAFDRSGAALEKVVQFTAANDAAALAETGESFLLRGAFDAGQEQVVEKKAIQTAARVRENKHEFPLADDAAPVELEIRYNGQKVPLEIREGNALIPEPQRQKVTFVLKRKGNSKERYGIVLKVNGQNTLYRQRLKDVQCRKWILDPGDEPITIRGFQREGGQAEEFKVLSPAESKAKEIDYGADVGTIALVVFREKQGKDRPLAVVSEEDEDLAALTRAVFPAEKPRNLAALKAQLRADATRGLIEGGDVIPSKVQQVKFQPDPTPVMTATITYYRP